MSTKYPIDFDDGVTLGPTFIDVAPPSDPQRDIAAEYRNNARDAIIAVQTRVGKTDDPSASSIDWGMLSVSGAPNQGLRFAGTHVNWPGLIAEDGIFIDTTSGNISFHKAGDNIGVFTDLTGGGPPPTWDAIYAVDKVLDINSTAFTWVQSSTTGYGFQMYRSVAGTAPLVQIHNQHLTDAQACLALDVNSPNAYFIKANYPAGGAGDEFFVDRVGNVGLKGDLQRIVNGNLTVSTSNGDIELDAGASDVQFQGNSGGLIPFNAASPDDALVGFTATSVIGALNEVKADVPTWDAIYAIDKSLNVNGLPFKIQGVAPNLSNVFTVERNLAATTGPLVAMYSSNTGEQKPVLEIATSSATAAGVSVLSWLTIPTGSLSVVESGFGAGSPLGASADVSMFRAYMGDDVGDDSATIYRGFYAEVLSVAGPAKKYGFSADANWGYGLHSESRVYLTDGASSTNPVLELDQGTAGLPFTDYIGTEAATQVASITSVLGDGPAIVGPQAKVGSVGWQFAKMVKVDINGSPYYICAYEPAP